jgi:CRP-like cAMP-binding protein
VTKLTEKPGNRLLASLPGEVFTALQNQLDWVVLKQGRVIDRARSPVRHLYFVDQGLVSLVKTMQDGRTVEIGAIGIEGLTGWNTLFGMEQAIVDSVVQIPGSAFRINQAALRQQMAKHQALRDLLMRYAQFGIADLSQSAACNRLHSIEERCCRWLLVAQDSARSDAFPLTHEFLAMMLGVHRTTVSLIASALQRAGMIRYRRGRLSITGRAGIEGMACECYSATRRELDWLSHVKAA